MGNNDFQHHLKPKQMDLTRNIIEKVKKSIKKYGMIEPRDIVIVAVSGGPDSMCMLDILYHISEELEITIRVAHFDHGMRPAEDESETMLVDQFARALKLPITTETALSSGYDKISSEEVAREARYRFLEDVRIRENGNKIAIGHNLNDQAETVIMRLLRGSGTSGMAGIPPVREKRIIRPLIEVSRDEIERYLRGRGILYAVDSSNVDRRFFRNRIRMELLPLMLEYQPRLIEHLGRLSDMLREEDRYLEKQVEAYAVKQEKSGFKVELSVPLSIFKSPSVPSNRLVRYMLKKAGGGLRRIDNIHIQAISDLAASNRSQGMLNLPNSLAVRKEYDRLIFFKGKERVTKDFEYILEGPQMLFIEDINRSIEITVVEKSMIPPIIDKPNIAYIDAEKVCYPLKIRNFKPGDRFIPLGMKGHRKIKDFFIDLKIPSRIRRSIPILLSKDSIVWICGYRLDNRYKITPETDKVMKVTIS